MAVKIIAMDHTVPFVASKGTMSEIFAAGSRISMIKELKDLFMTLQKVKKNSLGQISFVYQRN